MRIRTIKPEYWRNEELAGLTREVRMFGVALLNVADDDGFFRTHPALLAGDILPFDEDGKDFAGFALKRLADIGYVTLFESGIGQIVNFRKHQVINRPSGHSRLKEKAASLKLLQPLDSVNTHGVLTEPSLSTHGGLHDGKGTGNREREQGKGSGSGKQSTTTSEIVSVPNPKEPEDKFADGPSFFAFVQHKRLEVGCVPERPPHPSKLNTWWSEVGLELNGEYRRLEQALYRFADDPYWEKATPSMPFQGFMTQWRKYVPQAA